MEQRLIKAVVRGDKTKVARIFAHYKVDVNAISKDYIPVLSIASGDGNTEIVAMLIEAGAKINAKDKMGWTALMFASVRGRTDTVSVLLAYGASPNVGKDNFLGHTALVGAWRDGYIEIVSMLIEHGAEMDVKDGKGKPFFKLNSEKKNILKSVVS